MTQFEHIMLNVLQTDPAHCSETEYDWCTSTIKIAQRVSESGLTPHLELIHQRGPIIDVDIHQTENKQLVSLGVCALILQSGIPGYIACTESGSRVLAVAKALEV